MIKRLEQFFLALSETPDKNVISPRDIHLATAALMIEVATIDQNFDDSERQQLQLLLTSQCELSKTEAEELMNDAQQASKNSASLFEFTKLVNQHFDYDEKFRLVKNLWLVAYADDNLDKYEEHIIRRIADLIHVSHKDFIQAKILVRDAN